MPDPIDYDQAEREGDSARRAILEAALRSGLTAEAIGARLAKIANGRDHRMALRAMERMLDLSYAIPSRTRRVHSQVDQRILSATVGPGQLAGGMSEADLARLPPEQRRKALAALETLKQLTQPEIPTDGTSPSTDGRRDDRGELHECAGPLDAE